MSQEGKSPQSHGKNMFQLQKHLRKNPPLGDGKENSTYSLPRQPGVQACQSPWGPLHLQGQEGELTPESTAGLLGCAPPANSPWTAAQQPNQCQIRAEKCVIQRMEKPRRAALGNSFHAGLCDPGGRQNPCKNRRG